MIKKRYFMSSKKKFTAIKFKLKPDFPPLKYVCDCHHESHITQPSSYDMTNDY